jgi:hypothetical protein
LKFLAHENFPDFALKLLRQFESLKAFPDEILDVPSEYGSGAPVEDWLDCAGKQGPVHRPTIIILDDGIKTNAVGLQSMRESKCNFIVFARTWMDQPWTDFAWKLLKAWPSIGAQAQGAKERNRRCRIDVSINGKIRVTNL